MFYKHGFFNDVYSLNLNTKEWCKLKLNIKNKSKIALKNYSTINTVKNLYMSKSFRKEYDGVFDINHVEIKKARFGGGHMSGAFRAKWGENNSGEANIHKISNSNYIIWVIDNSSSTDNWVKMVEIILKLDEWTKKNFCAN